MAHPHNDIWQFQATLSKRLMRWASFNISSGTSLVARKDGFWRGFGAQCIGWGLFNAALAWLGRRNSRQNSATDDAHTPKRQEKERHNLARLLWINTGLDVAYMTGGLLLARNKGRKGQANHRVWRGTGWGIVLQGTFLFIFDLVHAIQLSDY